jgi:hypothetical protein
MYCLLVPLCQLHRLLGLNEAEMASNNMLLLYFLNIKQVVQNLNMWQHTDT